MDIAKRVHYACFVDERGRVIEKAFAVHQSKEGFEHLYEKIRQTMKEAKKTEVIVFFSTFYLSEVRTFLGFKLSR